MRRDVHNNDSAMQGLKGGNFIFQSWFYTS